LKLSYPRAESKTNAVAHLNGSIDVKEVKE